MDNFFASVNLAEKLKTEKTTLLGTIRKQRKEIQKIEATMRDKPLHSSEVYLSPSNATLTIYEAKKAKLVYLLSSMRKTVSVDRAHRKKLAKNGKNKKVASGCILNIIDCACINVYII